jgi:hypothetical protein
VPGVIDRAVRTAAIGLTVTVAAELTPAYAAVKVTGVEVVTLPVVTLNVAEAEPCGTVTEAGAPAIEALELEIDMVAPPVPAAAVRLTVPVPDCPLVMELGLTEMPLRAPGSGLTVTLEVALTPK